MALIDFKSVTIERDEQTLFENIDFQASAGEFIYLTGKVGSGKSSLLKTIYAELPIKDGMAQVFDYNLRSLKRRKVSYLRRKLGIIFQDFQLLTDRTVDENLRFVLRATGWNNKNAIDDCIHSVLQQVGMENKGYRMPNTLSGGEQQRIVIARALLNSPEIILADEPTGNLDPDTASSIVKLLYDICKSNNTAVIMSTHNLHFIDMFPGKVFKVEELQLKDVTPTSYQNQASLQQDITNDETGLDQKDNNFLDTCEYKAESPSEIIINKNDNESETLIPALLKREEGLQNAESEAETQTSLNPDLNDNKNDLSHCLQSDNQPLEPDYTS